MDHPPPKPALDRVAIERSGRADRSADAVLEDLSHVLWHQRQLIVDLVYRLEVQKLVLASGMTRWIATAASDVEGALEDIAAMEAVRSSLVEELAPLLGTAPDAGIRALVDAAPSPWDLILTEHHAELLALAAEAEATAGEGRELAQRGLGDVRGLLDEVGGTTATSEYGSSSSAARPDALLVDRRA